MSQFLVSATFAMVALIVTIAVIATMTATTIATMISATDVRSLTNNISIFKETLIACGIEMPVDDLEFHFATIIKSSPDHDTATT